MKVHYDALKISKKDKKSLVLFVNRKVFFLDKNYEFKPNTLWFFTITKEFEKYGFVRPLKQQEVDNLVQYETESVGGMFIVTKQIRYTGFDNKEHVVILEQFNNWQKDWQSILPTLPIHVQEAYRMYREYLDSLNTVTDTDTNEEKVKKFIDFNDRLSEYTKLTTVEIETDKVKVDSTYVSDDNGDDYPITVITPDVAIPSGAITGKMPYSVIVAKFPWLFGKNIDLFLLEETAEDDDKLAQEILKFIHRLFKKYYVKVVVKPSQNVIKKHHNAIVKDIVFYVRRHKVPERV